MLFGGDYNPEKIQKLMEKFGIKSKKIDAKEVVIKLKNKTITIKNPDILLTHVMNKDVYQISQKDNKKK